MPKFLLVFLGFFLAALGRPACGQPAPTEAPLAMYAAAFSSSPRLYNGPEYLDYTALYRTRTGHQFFLAPEMQPGSVYYNGQYFKDLHLAYDVVRDQLVLPQPTSPLTLRLIDERVRYFFIAGHRFVRLVADSAAGGAIRTGYYEVLGDSSVQVVAKRTKYLQERIAQGATDAIFLPRDKFFLRKAGVYYPVAGKGAVLRVLADHSQELQQFTKEHDLRFGQAELEASLVQLARYYNSLPPR
jgi:hypothetical protein